MQAGLLAQLAEQDGQQSTAAQGGLGDDHRTISFGLQGTQPVADQGAFADTIVPAQEHE